MPKNPASVTNTKQIEPQMNPYTTPKSAVIVEEPYSVKPEKLNRYLALTLVYSLVILACSMLLVLVPAFVIFLWLPMVYSLMKLLINLISAGAAYKMRKNSNQ